MVTTVFAAFLLLSMTVALIDWRRGWLMAVVCGVLQDPVRKMTPGTPVLITLSVMLVYGIALIAASRDLQRDAGEFTRRFSSVYAALILVFLFVVLAAFRGVFTYGIAGWKAPALSLAIYCAPVPAVLLGYAYLRREEQLTRFFSFYAVVTAIALIGTPLEYLNVHWPALGTVALPEAYIRHLPGIQIRLLAGFYRAPDIMGWHAAMLSIVGIIMTLRAKVLRSALPWIAMIAWGFFNCLLSGRRKALYMVVVFAVAFLWRYFRRLTIAQILAFVMAVLAVGWVVHKISQDEESSVYAKGAGTTQQELWGRLEGGLVETVQQFGILGAGLGSATQGVQHVSDTGIVGWQEGGLGKLAMELGVPGLITVFLLALRMLHTMLAISRHPDVDGSSQLMRCALFAIVVATVVEFLASAQAYSDALLTLMSAFFLGAFFATAVLDERAAAASAPAQPPLTAPAAA